MITSDPGGSTPTTATKETELIPVTDRGLLYGDGLFETLAVVEGSICCWQAHMARLARGAERLALPMPDAESLLEQVRQLTGSTSGRLRLTLTRGDGPPGYRPPIPAKPRLLLRFDPQILAASATHSRMPVHIRLCKTRIGISPALAGIKHLNRLEQVLARQEWSDPEIFEGLMLDPEGLLICGTASNLFLLDAENGLLTPRLDRSGVAGTVRTLVLEEAARLGIPCKEDHIDLDRLHSATAIFVTNALNGVVLARTCDGRQLQPERVPGALIEKVQRRVFST